MKRGIVVGLIFILIIGLVSAGWFSSTGNVVKKDREFCVGIFNRKCVSCEDIDCSDYKWKCRGINRVCGKSICEWDRESKKCVDDVKREKTDTSGLIGQVV